MVSCDGYFLSSIFKNSIKSELLWVSLTNGIASPVSKSMPASKESVPRRFILHHDILPHVLMSGVNPVPYWRLPECPASHHTIP